MVLPSKCFSLFFLNTTLDFKLSLGLHHLGCYLKDIDSPQKREATPKIMHKTKKMESKGKSKKMSTNKRLYKRNLCMKKPRKPRRQARN